MKLFIGWLQGKERKLAELLDLPEPDFDDIFHTVSDELLAEWGEREQRIRQEQLTRIKESV